MSRLFVLLLLSVLFRAALLAQWHELPGPSGGRVYDFAEIASTNGGRIYAATANGVYRTTDHAKSWQLMGLTHREVMKITQYQIVGQEILLANVNDSDGWHVCRSSDSAKTWDTIFTSRSQNPIVEILQDGNDIVAAAQGGFDSVCGIYRSTDLGGHWSHQSSVPPPLIFFDCTMGNGTIFAIADSGLHKGVWSIPSHGATWSKTNYPYWHHASSVRMSGSDLFVGGWGRIDISTDNGVTWLPVPNAGLDTVSNAFLNFAVSGTTIVASSEVFGDDAMYDYGIFRTTNGGTSWQQIEGTGGYPRASSTWTINFIDNQFFAGADAGVLVSNDGIQWKYATDGLVGPVEDVIEHKGILFAATPRGVFHSSDHGETWTVPIDSADLLDSVASAFAEVGNDLYAFIAIGSREATKGLWKWDGAQWKTVRDEFIGSVTGQGSALFTSIDDGHGLIEKSTDSGVTWSPSNNGLPTGESVEVLFSAPGKLFAIGYQAIGPSGHDLVYVSTDAGGSWNELAVLPVRGPAYSAVSVGNSIFVAGGGGLSVSTDGGVTWTSSKVLAKQVRQKQAAAVITTSDSIFGQYPLEEVPVLANSQTSPLHAFTSDDQFAYAATISRGLWAAPLANLPLAVPMERGRAGSTDLRVYPNPTKNKVTFVFNLPDREAVTLLLYDDKGVALATLFDGFAQGNFSISFDASLLPQGPYVAVLSTPHGSAVVHLIISGR